MSCISRIEGVPNLTKQVYRRRLCAIGDGELACQSSITFRSLKSLPAPWNEQAA